MSAEHLAAKREFRGWATKSSVTDAKRSFEAGMTVLVSERPEGNEKPVYTNTTTHTKETTTWKVLNGYVKEWRSRYPGQTYYVVTEWAPGMAPR